MPKKKLNTLLFADPDFYRTFRQKVIPILKTYPSVKIWNVGCANPEDLYSLAILLHEGGLHENWRIYATDSNQLQIARAKNGSFTEAAVKESSAKYKKSGGKGKFLEYFASENKRSVVSDELKAHVSFFHHHLAVEGSLNEFQLILCRGMLTRMSTGDANQAHKLLLESLCHFGVLCLGSGEKVDGTGFEAHYKLLDNETSLFKRTA